MRKHPRSIAARQLAAPLLLVGLVSPLRRPVAATYLSLILLRTAREVPRDPRGSVGMAAALPTMHLCWGVGFLRGLISGPRRTSA